jgi:hypothetical protein
VFRALVQYKKVNQDVPLPSSSLDPASGPATASTGEGSSGLAALASLRQAAGAAGLGAAVAAGFHSNAAPIPARLAGATAAVVATAAHAGIGAGTSVTLSPAK